MKNNLYRTAQKFAKLFKFADEELLELEPMHPEAKSKNTPTEFGDPDKRIFTPLLLEIRSEIHPFRNKIKILLHSGKILHSQLSKLIPFLERIDSGLEKVNLGLALAQKNKTSREQILSQCYDIFISVFSAAKQASDLLSPETLSVIQKNSITLFDSDKQIENWHRKIQSLYELARQN